MPSPLNTRAIFDVFFKAIFDDGGRAGSFTSDHVADFRDRVIGELEPVSQLFTDDELLRETQCDCLFKARMKPVDGGAAQPGYVFVLFEHKSYKADDVLLQMLKYITAITLRAKKRGQPPPPVIPILFYHGREKWDMPRCLGLTFGEGATAPGLRLRVVTVNLNDLDQDHLATDPHVHAAFYAMRFCQGALKGKPGLEDVARAIPVESPLTQNIVAYLMGAGKYGVNAVKSAMAKFHPKGEQIVNTTAMQLIDQGRVEGEAKGRVEGRVEGEAKGRVEGEAKLLSRMLQRKFGPLPPDLQQRIAQASTDEIESWSDRIWDAPSARVVLDGR